MSSSANHALTACHIAAPPPTVFACAKGTYITDIWGRGSGGVDEWTGIRCAVHHSAMLCCVKREVNELCEWPPFLRGAACSFSVPAPFQFKVGANQGGVMK